MMFSDSELWRERNTKFSLNKRLTEKCTALTFILEIWTGRLTATVTVRLLDLRGSSQTVSLTSNNFCCLSGDEVVSSYHNGHFLQCSTNKQTAEIKSTENKVKFDSDTEQITEMLLLRSSECQWLHGWIINVSVLFLFSGPVRPDSLRTEQNRRIDCGCNDH